MSRLSPRNAALIALVVNIVLALGLIYVFFQSFPAGDYFDSNISLLLLGADSVSLALMVGEVLKHKSGRGRITKGVFLYKEEI